MLLVFLQTLFCIIVNKMNEFFINYFIIEIANNLFVVLFNPQNVSYIFFFFFIIYNVDSTL